MNSQAQENETREAPKIDPAKRWLQPRETAHGFFMTQDGTIYQRSAKTGAIRRVGKRRHS